MFLTKYLKVFGIFNYRKIIALYGSLGVNYKISFKMIMSFIILNYNFLNKFISISILVYLFLLHKYQVPNYIFS